MCFFGKIYDNPIINWSRFFTFAMQMKFIKHIYFFFKPICIENNIQIYNLNLCVILSKVPNEEFWFTTNPILFCFIKIETRLETLFKTQQTLDGSTKILENSSFLFICCLCKLYLWQGKVHIVV